MSDPPRTSPHFLRSVTAVAERRRVVAHRDIYNERGVKMAASGLRIDHRIYERLVNQKLIPPLEEALAIDGAVDAAAVAVEAHEALKRSPALRAITAPLPIDMAEALARSVQLAPVTAFKLTVAREETPKIWRHSVLVALVCLYLGHRLNLPRDSLDPLTTAGLLHDIGMLHIDDRLFGAGPALGEEVRHPLYTHPILAHLIISRQPEYPPEVATAVLEHHERIDGGGYPRGLHGEQQSFLGRLLAAAEVIASRFDHHGRLHGGRRLDMMLKMYSRKIYGEVLPLLTPFTEVDDAGEALHERGAESVEMIEGWLFVFKRLIEEWREVTDAIEGTPLDPEGEALTAFVHEQVEGLHYDLRRGGFSTEAWAWIADGAEEDAGQREDLRALVHETRWRLAEIHHEAHRRWPNRIGREDALAPLLHWLAEAAVVARPTYEARD